MDINQIRELPTHIAGNDESMLRSYQILETVKGYLKNKVPSDTILELIGEMEKKP